MYAPNMDRVNAIAMRLYNFNVALIEEDVEAAAGRISNLPNKVKTMLLGPQDEGVHVHCARTIKEVDRLPDVDVTVFDDGREQAIFWYHNCLRLS